MARKYSKKASTDVRRAMKKRKAGTLKSGRSGRKVKSRKQAIAIGLSEARAKGKKVPKKAAKKRKASKKKTAKKSKRKGEVIGALDQPTPSCPGLSRASTYFVELSKKDVDGRDRPGRDGRENLTPPCGASPPNGALSSPPAVSVSAAKPGQVRAASPQICPSGWL